MRRIFRYDCPPVNREAKGVSGGIRAALETPFYKALTTIPPMPPDKNNVYTREECAENIKYIILQSHNIHSFSIGEKGENFGGVRGARVNPIFR